MKDLQDLIAVVTKNKVRRIEIIGDQTNRSSKQLELYEGIAKGRFESEKDAIDILYPNHKKGREYYLRLKNRLRNRILNTLFFIDTSAPQFNDLQKAYYSTHKRFAEVKILLGRGARSPAIQLAEKTIKKTVAFEFTDLTILLARILQSHYGQIVQSRAKYDKYKEILHNHQEVYKFEILAEEYFTELNLLAKKDPDTTLENAYKFLKELHEVKDRIDSFRFIQFYYFILLIKYNLENDSSQVLSTCEEIITKFTKVKKYNPSNLIALYLNESIPISINQKKYSTGEKIAQKALNILSPTQKNWYVTNQLLVILYLHSKKYQEAHDLFRRVKEKREYQNLNDIFKERWLIIEAFINYLLSKGKIESKRNKTKRFRLGKFVNQVPKYSKDKRGLNITIIIIQILFLLEKRDYSEIIDRMDSLNAYCFRYLRRNETFRSNCFIKMILKLPQANFNKIAASRKTEKLYKKLKSVPISSSLQGSEIEFIPYEDLWLMIIDSLRKQSSRLKYR